MDIQSIVSSIDAEIAKLQQARTLLSDVSPVIATAPAAKKRGRPKGSSNAKKAIAPAKKSAKRAMSPEARAKIAAAQKARWATAKKTAAK